MVDNEFRNGAVVEGMVLSVTRESVLIDLGAGVMGSIDLCDVSRSRGRHALNEMYSVGERATFNVICIDRATETIPLTPHIPNPDWPAALDRFQVGSRYMGEVVSITTFGIYVMLANGVEGLLEFGEESIAQHTNIGDVIEVMIDGVNLDERKFRLSISN